MQALIFQKYFLDLAKLYQLVLHDEKKVFPSSPASSEKEENIISTGKLK
jgi:hypothetical protein